MSHVAIIRVATLVSLVLIGLGVWFWVGQVVIAGVAGFLASRLVSRLMFGRRGNTSYGRRRRGGRLPWGIKHRKSFRFLLWRVNTSGLRYTSTTFKAGPLSRNSATGRWTLDLPGGFYRQWGGNQPAVRGRR